MGPAEYAAFGFRFRPAGERLDLLDEAAGAIRSLLHDGKADSDGAHVWPRDARLEPRLAQRHPPIWIGGIGERRTARIVARHGDG